MLNLWKRKPALGIGIGVSLVGAVALATRYGFRRAPRERIPDDISPAIFATRVTETIFGEMIYHISGSGDPVVFLHGIYLGASSSRMVESISALYLWPRSHRSRFDRLRRI